VPAQTDRTDRQTGAQITEQPTELAASDLSRNLSRDDRDGQIGTNRGSQDDFPDLPAFLRRVPDTRGPAPALGPPGDSLDGADGRTQVIEEEEEEASEWTL